MKTILEVIKFEGNNHLLVWKHPAEDFNTHSKLVVREGQVAVLFCNGKVADVFDKAGRYDLHTGNIPILRKILELPYGGVSSFHCQVYFVNLVEAMDIKWGLPSRATWLDPVYGIKLNIGARGNLSIRVENAKDMLIQLVGSETELTAEGLTRYFRDLMTMRIKAYLSQVVRNQSISVFDMDANIECISQAIKEKMAADYADYGFRLRMFSISEFVYPEDNPDYIRLLAAISERTTGVTEAETARIQATIAARASAESEIIRSQGRAAALAALGTDHVKERQLDIAENMSLNETMNQYSGMAGSMAMMAGSMNLGVQAATAMSNAMNAVPSGQMGVNPYMQQFGIQNPQPATAPSQGMQMQQTEVQESGMKTCINCGAKLPIKAKFCMECSAPQPAVCKKCGAVLPESAKFCMECGEPV